ncbi:MAG: hypothetical protein ACKUBY_00180 [Candidatus Moraniibacteriota bacterium]|jgi:hypothetical protein
MGIGEEPITISADNFKADVDKFANEVLSTKTETSEGNMALDETVLKQAELRHADLEDGNKEVVLSEDSSEVEANKIVESEEQNIQKIVEGLGGNTVENVGDDLTNLNEVGVLVSDIVEKVEIEISENLIKEGNLADIHNQITAMKKYCEDNEVEIESMLSGENEKDNVIEYILQNYNK